MLRIDLTPREAELLEAVLESYLSDLRSEIVHTERTSFREGLREREALLTRLLAQLAAERAAP
jgi:hypothetical protein